MVCILLVLGCAAKDRWRRPMDNPLKRKYKAKLCMESVKNDHDGGMDEAVRAKRSEKGDAGGGI